LALIDFLKIAKFVTFIRLNFFSIVSIVVLLARSFSCHGFSRKYF
jgi:hypothetical protein